MRRVTETTRVCKSPDCPFHGEAQPIEQFRISRKNGNPWYRRTCRACESIKYQKYWAKNKEKLNEGRVWIQDQDITDLVPMNAGGYVRWAVISNDRRRALGETSPYNGLSITRDREKD